jgi:hypothetical protein
MPRANKHLIPLRFLGITGADCLIDDFCYLAAPRATYMPAQTIMTMPIAVEKSGTAPKTANPNNVAATIWA